MQGLTGLLSKLQVNIYSDMDSAGVRAFTWLYKAVSQFSWKVFRWPSRWGYFHVGQILEIDSDKDETFQGVGETKSPGDRHNLEVRRRARFRVHRV